MGGLFSKSNGSAGGASESEDPALNQAGAAGDGATATATAKEAQELGSEPLVIEEKEYSEIVEDIATGDLAVLYREGWKQPHFGVFIQHKKDEPDFPLLLVKGKSKPLPLAKFDKTLGREAHTTSAINRIFYGDYVKVHIRHILTNEIFPIDKVVENVEKVQKVPFSEYELEAIEKAESDDVRSALVSALMVAHFYQLMPVSSDPVFNGDPARVTPDTLQDCLKLSKPEGIKLPATKPGPLATGEAPLFDRIVQGIRPPPEITVVPLDSVAGTFNTGDIILLSGATNSGAIIKLFDNSQFSHVGIVFKFLHTAQLMIFQSSTNRAGLVDVESGKVVRGVELLPLRHQIYSGWYERVAIRRLTGVDDEQRKQMYKDLLKFRTEVQGRPYEKSDLELARSALDFQEDYLSFLRNTHEDLSSLFCSELVAEAYKRMGILNTEKLSNEFTPDDFSSARDSKLTLNFGKLEPEVYIELKFEKP